MWACTFGWIIIYCLSSPTVIIFSLSTASDICCFRLVGSSLRLLPWVSGLLSGNYSCFSFASCDALICVTMLMSSMVALTSDISLSLCSITCSMLLQYCLLCLPHVAFWWQYIVLICCIPSIVS